MDNITVKMVDGVPRHIRKLVVHRFELNELDDPDIYAAVPIEAWKRSDAGQYVMERCLDRPILDRHMSASDFTVKYAVTAELYEEDASYFALKWIIK